MMEMTFPQEYNDIVQEIFQMEDDSLSYDEQLLLRLIVVLAACLRDNEAKEKDVLNNITFLISTFLCCEGAWHIHVREPDVMRSANNEVSTLLCDEVAIRNISMQLDKT